MDPLNFPTHSLWIPGEPPSDRGYCLVRCLTYSRPWIYVVNVCRDPSNAGFNIYWIGGGGSRLGDPGMTRHGKLTHYSDPENFPILIKDMQEHNKALDAYGLVLMERRLASYENKD